MGSWICHFSYPRFNKIHFTFPLPDFQHPGQLFLTRSNCSLVTWPCPWLKKQPLPSPSLNHISAKNLINTCPPSLVKALHPSNHDRDVWLNLYQEEMGELEALNIFSKINNKQYIHLPGSSWIGKTLPSMCVLVIKQDSDGTPAQTNYCIVVLGNFVGIPPNLSIVHQYWNIGPFFYAVKR
jgi:hypothetical protein